MKKTRLVYVHGGDYAALNFDLDNYVQKMENGEEFENEDSETEVDYYEFGEVDPNFIAFVQSIQDYDSSKHSNFFVLDK